MSGCDDGNREWKSASYNHCHPRTGRGKCMLFLLRRKIKLVTPWGKCKSDYMDKEANHKYQRTEVLWAVTTLPKIQSLQQNCLRHVKKKKIRKVWSLKLEKEIRLPVREPDIWFKRWKEMYKATRIKNKRENNLKTKGNWWQCCLKTMFTEWKEFFLTETN